MIKPDISTTSISIFQKRFECLHERRTRIFLLRSCRGIELVVSIWKPKAWSEQQPIMKMLCLLMFLISGNFPISATGEYAYNNHKTNLIVDSMAILKIWISIQRIQIKLRILLLWMIRDYISTEFYLSVPVPFLFHENSTKILALILTQVVSRKKWK